MIEDYLLKRNSLKSLRAQIGDAERELLNRQRRGEVSTDTLVGNILRELTAPATILLAAGGWRLAAGVGFILGELTQRQTTKCSTVAGNQRMTETSPLRIALNLTTSIQTLYTPCL